MAELKPLHGHGDYYIWKYVPSLPAAIIFALLWISICGLLGWRMWKTKTWFCSAFVIGCLMEFVGYSARASATDKTDMLMPFVVQNAFILLPPALFAATIYMCLGRIIRLVGGDHLSILRPGIVTKVFVTGDVLSFLIQGGSAGLTVMGSTNPTMAVIGQDMVIAGLASQLISFAFFLLTAFIFYLRLRRNPTARSYEVNQNWVQGMYLLYSLSSLIIIRSIFRIVEYCMGQEGYALSHEWTLYIFDTALMITSAVIFYFWYPSYLTPNLDDALHLESQTSDESIIPKHP